MDITTFKELMADKMRLAQEYVNNNPREESYPVTLGSIDDDSHGIYCHKLSDDEKALIMAWQTMTENDELYGADLDEFLAEKLSGMTFSPRIEKLFEKRREVARMVDLNDERTRHILGL